MRVAFIGLGIMGSPMAANLLRAGLEVTVYTRTPARAASVLELGATWADSVPEAVRDAEIIATMLPDSPDVRTVLEGAGGAFDSATRGSLFVDFSTIRPDIASDLHSVASEHKFRMIDAPVSGGEQGAIDGTLSIMVGGAGADFAAAEPVLTAVGGTVVHVGPPSAGQTVKAANQLIVAGTLELLAEAIVFLEAHGVDTEQALRVIGGGLAGSTILERKGTKMLARDFTPGFRIALHNKDMGIVMSAAREAGVAIPMGSIAAQLIGVLNAQGFGGYDHSALLKTVEELSGRGPEAGAGSS